MNIASSSRHQSPLSQTLKAVHEQVQHTQQELVMHKYTMCIHTQQMQHYDHIPHISSVHGCEVCGDHFLSSKFLS